MMDGGFVSRNQFRVLLLFFQTTGELFFMFMRGIYQTYGTFQLLPTFRSSVAPFAIFHFAFDPFFQFAMLKVFFCYCTSEISYIWALLVFY